MASQRDTLRYDVAEDGVATIALDQPDTRNALSDELLDDLLAAFSAARDDDAVRCVVLASTHETTFSAGGNLAGFAADVPLVHKHFATGRFPQLFTLIGELGKPSICAANGHCLAGALGLALACDLVVAAEEATFGTPEINVGRLPVHDHGADLPQRRRARRPTSCCCSASASTRTRPSASGSSTASCRAEEFDAAVADWAGRLAAKSPVMMRLGKDALCRQQDMALEDALGLPARAADASRSRPRTSRRACRRSSRSGSRGGRAGDAPRCCAARRIASPRPRRAPRALAEALAELLGAEARMVGTPGEPRRRRWDDDLRDARGCLLEAGGQVEDALARGSLPGPDRVGLLDLHDDAAGRRAPRARTRGCCGSTPTRDFNDARDDAVAVPRRHVPGRARAACGTRASTAARIDPARVVMCGVRDVDAGERVLVETNGVGLVERPSRLAELLEDREVFVHLDLDVLDPARACPGCVPRRRRLQRRRPAHAAGRGRRGGRRDRRARSPTSPRPRWRAAWRRSSSRCCLTGVTRRG